MRTTTARVVKAFILVYAAMGILGGVVLNRYLEEHQTVAAGRVETQIPASSPTPTPELLPPAPPPVVVPIAKEIDGLLTYGEDKPLTADEFAELVKYLNSDPLPISADTYYVTFLATESSYRTFLQDYDESLQSYLLRHVAWADREFKEANPPVEGGLVPRRLIIVDDDVFESENVARGYDYSAQGLADSNGSWTFMGAYRPETYFYYKPNLRLDAGLIHEWIHTVFHLPDHYGLDFYDPGGGDAFFEGINEWWRRTYLASARPDISRNDFAMGGDGLTLRHYSALQLSRQRRGETVVDPTTGFPAQVPQRVVLDFGPEFADAPITIYQTKASENANYKPYFAKELSPDPIVAGRLDGLGRILIAGEDLFRGSSQTVPYSDGVIFIRVEVGEAAWIRWMDIRDFNLAYWHGFTNSVLMKMKLASFEDDPVSFDWSIVYEDADFDGPDEPSVTP